MKNPNSKWSENELETRLYIQYSVTDIKLSFEPFFYQTANYLNAAGTNKNISFYLFRTGEIPSIACIHFVKNDTGFISPAHAPFGGIQCDKKCTREELCFFIRCIENWFSAQPDSSLRIKSSPTCYNTTLTNHFFASIYALFGYKVTEKFRNYHIQVSESPFLEILAPAEVRRLAKCKKSGFRAGLYDKPDVDIVYNFIKHSRDVKGYSMSMTLAQLKILINNFPRQSQVFVVTDESKIIALTVTILVCKRILYNFLPSDLPDYRNFSPMVYLTEAVYNHCQKEKIAVLDLGISLDIDGKEKPGLQKFKKNLGGKKSCKITYEKLLKSDH